VIALVGPNGAGKTTLLQLVTGLVRPTEGTVEVFGTNARAGSAEALAGVGFVAQEHPLYRGFSVADLLRMGRELNLRWDQALAEQRLAELGIPLGKRAGALSGGQQAQVALALALATRPALLVLDEPLANLDPIARRDFMRTVMSVVADGEITVLLSSHVIADLEVTCDWLVLLKDGRLLLAGAIDDVLAEHRVLTGPQTNDDRPVPGLVRATHSDRHTDLLVRTETGAPELHPTWRAHPVGLEELILAYLERPAVTR
jgi:ABC-2 type transport system ATP-binding protein